MRATAFDLATRSGGGNSRARTGRMWSPKTSCAASRMACSCWIVPVGRYSRPPIARVSPIERRNLAGSSAPVGPPAGTSSNQPDAAAIASGIPETSPISTSACTSRTGSSRSPERNSQMWSSPSRRAFSLAASTARCDRSTPYTLAAPSFAATIERTPLPQPTSITVSPDVISRASARVRLVVVGLKTPGPRRSGKGPSRPFQWVSTFWLTIGHSGRRGKASESTHLDATSRLHLGRFHRRIGPGNEFTGLDGHGVGLESSRQSAGPDAADPIGVCLHAPCSSPEQGDRPVRIATQQMDVARAHLGEPLEQLFLARSARLLPRGLPGFVRPEVVASAEQVAAETIVLLHRQGVEIGQVEQVHRFPSERPAQLVSGSFLLLPAFRGNTRLARGFFRHPSMLAAPATELADALDSAASAQRLHVDRDHADRAVRLKVCGSNPAHVRDPMLPDRRLDLLRREALVPQPVWHEGAILHKEGRPALQQPLAERRQTQQADDREVHHEEHGRRDEAARE